MYPSQKARELSILLRISRELDSVGDVTATVDSPSELLAWSSLLDDPSICAWRGEDSGQRYIQVTALHEGEPVRGRVTAVLHGEQHRHFWEHLLPDDLEPGKEQPLSRSDLSEAWTAMPIATPDSS